MPAIRVALFTQLPIIDSPLSGWGNWVAETHDSVAIFENRPNSFLDFCLQLCRHK